MAVQVSTKPANRHVLGDLCARFYVLSGVADADTLTVGQAGIRSVIITPDATAGAANNPGASWAGPVITFHSGGVWSGTVMVLSREG